jgi:hypothetical protein
LKYPWLFVFLVISFASFLSAIFLLIQTISRLWCNGIMKRLHEAKVALPLPPPLSRQILGRETSHGWRALNTKGFPTLLSFPSRFDVVGSLSCPKIAKHGKILKYNVNDEREPK